MNQHYPLTLPYERGEWVSLLIFGAAYPESLGRIEGGRAAWIPPKRNVYPRQPNMGGGVHCYECRAYTQNEIPLLAIAAQLSAQRACSEWPQTNRQGVQMTLPTYPSFAEFYQNSNDTQFPHEQRTGGSFPIHLTRARQTAVDFVDPPIPELSLVIGLQADIPFKWDIGDGWTKEQHYRTRDLVFCPANTAIRHDCGGDHEILFCSFPAKSIAALLDEEMGLDLSVFNPLHGPVFQDEIIQTAALRMWAESVQPDPTSNLMINGLCQTVVAQLLRRANTKVPGWAEQLSPAVVKRVRDFVAANCSADLRIADLARVAGCSPFHFARSFKQTTGQSPYQYILAYRIARACELLVADHRLVAEIALECGFHDQPHLTRMFKKHLGITPGKYRQEHH